MNRCFFLSRLRVFVLFVCAVFATCGRSNEPVSLFDGKTLAGWEGDRQYWRVEEGAIVGEIPKGQSLGKNTWLVWRDGTLDNFDLRLRVKLRGAPAANSGIQFRCQVDNIEHVSGYQADLDQGARWLGRIYDEHGRALLVERGSRVWIDGQGNRQVETFAPAGQYAVLFRQDDWNDYRIVAVGEHVAVYINGTLFSELKDQQLGERDLSGSLAFQLHSGPETRVEFRDVFLERLDSNDDRLGEFQIKTKEESDESEQGVSPTHRDGATLNLGFELGSLAGWTSKGDAFDGQPVRDDGIASRWPGQKSNKNGDYFIGGFEVVRDRGTGTLTSPSFPVTAPYGSFLIGGGSSPQTRVDLFLVDSEGQADQIIHTAVGDQREQMRRVIVDLRKWQGQQIAIQLVDESSGGWGHLNFDDFRFHDSPPVIQEEDSAWRSTRNPLLQHLVPNVLRQSHVDQSHVDQSHVDQSPDEQLSEELAVDSAVASPSETLRQMHVPPGFSVELVAAEPDLHQPMAFTFDSRGRIWVAEGYSYPEKRPEGEGIDRILIFSDRDNDGVFEDRKVFIEGLNLVSGMEVGHGGVWVGAAPQLLFIPDRDRDDRPDGEPEVLLDGFGYADTHETLNSFLWGPDGWLYGNQGVFNNSRIGKPGSPEGERQSLNAGVWRYHPTRHEFEVFAHGGSNQWGLDYDLHGQLLMTHCRSYWGRGPTTHVMQGGHYWNQVNGGYAPFVSPVAPPHLPEMRNFLLASARYGHGEGGAGKKGSRAVYGGHSHVGTMIYLGDNWPDQYRNHLFTHNLHGHQMNHQVNVREAGGYRTLHAGYDMLFCADPQFIGVDLKVGPDGAVYFSDWYDPRHCHNPNVEQWDRGNGRIYRMQYDNNYRPVAVDYSIASDDQLVEAQLHRNDWHVRAARLVMHERAAAGQFSADGEERLRRMALQHPLPDRRLRAVWCLHAIGSIDAPLAERLMADSSEYVRAWAVQLAVESLPEAQLGKALERLSREDPSLLVRRYLASAIDRLSEPTGWSIATSIARRADTHTDRELTLLLWYGIAKCKGAKLDEMLQLADDTSVPSLRDMILWYAAKLSSRGRDVLARQLFSPDAENRLHDLELLELAVRGMRGLTAPVGWSDHAADFYHSDDPSIRSVAESLGASFGDQALFERMRDVLASGDSQDSSRLRAVTILEADDSSKNLEPLLSQLDNEALAARVVPMLIRYDDPKVADALIARFLSWPEQIQAEAMGVLVSRSSWAHQVLDAVEAGSIPENQLTAFHVRQIDDLDDPTLRKRLAAQWGSLSQSSEERRNAIDELVGLYQTAPLWAYSSQAGEGHFKKLCANCHRGESEGVTVAPKIAGSRLKGVAYLVENILDPNAVIGRDFQARNVLTIQGLVVTGLVENETDSAIMIRTATNTVTIAKDDIEEIRVSENSFMPEGLLKTLNDREKLELLKYLMSL